MAEVNGVSRGVVAKTEKEPPKNLGRAAKMPVAKVACSDEPIYMSLTETRDPEPIYQTLDEATRAPEGVYQAWREARAQTVGRITTQVDLHRPHKDVKQKRQIVQEKERIENFCYTLKQIKKFFANENYNSSWAIPPGCTENCYIPTVVQTENELNPNLRLNRHEDLSELIQAIQTKLDSTEAE